MESTVLNCVKVHKTVLFSSKTKAYITFQAVNSGKSCLALEAFTLLITANLWAVTLLIKPQCITGKWFESFLSFEWCLTHSAAFHFVSPLAFSALGVGVTTLFRTFSNFQRDIQQGQLLSCLCLQSQQSKHLFWRCPHNAKRFSGTISANCI